MKIKVAIIYKIESLTEEVIECDDFPFFDDGFLHLSLDRETRKTKLICQESIDSIEYEKSKVLKKTKKNIQIPS